MHVFHQLTFIFVFLGIMLIFPLSYPLLRPSLGITLVFHLSYPLLRPSLGITLIFHLPYPLLRPSLGITLVFHLPYPLLCHSLGITPVFHLSYPLLLSCQKCRKDACFLTVHKIKYISRHPARHPTLSSITSVI